MTIIIKDEYREPKSGRIYEVTGKEPDIGAATEDAYWMLSGKIGLELGSGGGTLGDIYHRVTGPLGLSLSTTKELVKKSVESGYLK